MQRRALAARVTNMSDTHDHRLTDLEVRYTYLERHVRELDHVIIELRAQVDRLQRELKELRHTDEPSDPGNEKPPHY